MVPVLEPDAFTTLSTWKNDISSMLPRKPGRIPLAFPDAEAAITLAVYPVLVRSLSVKLSATCVVSGDSDSVWSVCSLTTATGVTLIAGLSSVPVTVTTTVRMVVPP